MLSAILPAYSIKDLIDAVANKNIELMLTILARNKNLISQIDEVSFIP